MNEWINEWIRSEPELAPSSAFFPPHQSPPNLIEWWLQRWEGISNKKSQGESDHGFSSETDRECIKEEKNQGWRWESQSWGTGTMIWHHDPRKSTINTDSMRLPRESDISADTFRKTWVGWGGRGHYMWKGLEKERLSDVYVKTEGCSEWIENRVRELH